MNIARHSQSPEAQSSHRSDIAPVKWPDPGTPRPPARGNAVSQALAKAILRSMGWRITGHVPSVKRLVAVAGPHTSNWDFIIGMFVLGALKIRMNFMIKQSVFKFGFGAVLRWLGALPVNRKNPKAVYAAALQGFEQNPDGQVLIVTPEGTRSGKTKLKDGFYRIARKSDSALLPVTIDYSKRVVTLLPWIDISDLSFEEVEGHLDDCFEGIPGKNGYWMDRVPASKAGEGQL